MTFQQLLEENGYETRSYSGRAMYGKDCLAVTVGDIPTGVWDIATILAEFNAEAEAMNEETIPQPKFIKWDNMGLQYVIYWTRVPYVEDTSHPMSGAL